jgi:hypothetical protein
LADLRDIASDGVDQNATKSTSLVAHHVGQGWELYLEPQVDLLPIVVQMVDAEVFTERADRLAILFFGLNLEVIVATTWLMEQQPSSLCDIWPHK